VSTVAGPRSAIRLPAAACAAGAHLPLVFCECATSSVHYDHFSSTRAQTHSVPLQAAVDPSVSAEVLARYLLQPPATLAVADCFRPVLLEILNCLLDKKNEYTATNAVRYYIAVEQILEVAPHLERYTLLACICPINICLLLSGMFGETLCTAGSFCHTSQAHRQYCSSCRSLMSLNRQS